MWVKLDRSCLKQDKITFTHRKAVNIYIAYEINLWSFTRGDFTLANFAVELVKNADQVNSNIQEMVAITELFHFLLVNLVKL